ncbi:hypothetical protein COBT_002614 [Conglomerata obtusa]
MNMITKLLLLIQMSIETYPICESDNFNIQLITNCDVKNNYNKVALIWVLFKSIDFETLLPDNLLSRNFSYDVFFSIKLFHFLFNKLIEKVGKSCFKNENLFISDYDFLLSSLNGYKKLLKDNSEISIDSEILPMVEMSYNLIRLSDFLVDSKAKCDIYILTQLFRAGLFFELITMLMLSEPLIDRGKFFSKLLRSYIMEEARKKDRFVYFLENSKVETIHCREIRRNQLGNCVATKSFLNLIFYYNEIYDIELCVKDSYLIAIYRDVDLHKENVDLIKSYSKENKEYAFREYVIEVNEDYKNSFFDMLNLLHQYKKRKLYCFTV